MTERLIGVTGATGAIGGRVVRLLAERGARQRLIVRDAARAPRADGAEVRAAAGYEHPEAFRDALDGVHTLLLVSATEGPDRVAAHLSAVDAAVAAGVQHVVYLSFLGAAPDATFTLARDHHATEEAIRAHDLPHTFLRDSLYLDLVPMLVGTDGVLRGPAGKGRVAGIARDDVAAAATAVLTGDGHAGRTYDLTGPEAFTLAEAADVMAQWSGRPVRFHDEELQEAFESRMAPDVTDHQIDGWVTSYLAVRAGELDVVSGAVRQLTGRDPIGLWQVLEQAPGCLDHVGTA